MTTLEGVSIAIFLPRCLGHGGAEHLSLNLATGFVARGARVTFVLQEEGGDLVEARPPGTEVVSLCAGRSLQALPRLARYLRRAQPDIVLAQTNYSNVIALLARVLSGSRARVIAFQHSPFSIEITAQDGGKSRWQHGVLPILYRVLLPRADAIVAVSRAVADDLADALGWPRERVDMIYNAVVLPDSAVRASLPIDHPWLGGEEPVFLAVGRLQPVKDYATMLEAFARLVRRRPARLIVLGDGPERPRMASQCEALGIADRVDLHGWEDNPLAYMSRATALVLSSRYEGFGIVLVEALSCGTPVISTDCPGGPREILLAGRLGELVPVGDSGAMAAAMERVLEGRPDREALRVRARDFELEPIVEQYVTLFRRVLGAADGH
jgi:glycosyltransferase involved in cell wall biosynthesis